VRSLTPTAEQRIIAQTARRFCAEWLIDSGERVERRFDRPAWLALADLGMLELTGARDIVALVEELGRAGFAGPLVQVFTAAMLLTADDREAVLSGRNIVTIAGASLRVPWAPVAQVFIRVQSDTAHLGRVSGEIKPLRTLSGAPWGIVRIVPGADLGNSVAAVANGNLTLAAYLAGAARRMVEIAAEYAAHRRQFGKPIGDFQGVAHPLAEAWARTTAALDLARFAALKMDERAADAPAAAAAARLSAVAAARRASYTGHQVLGAMGYVDGTLLSTLSRIVAQESLLPPGNLAVRAGLLATMPGLAAG
jgi:alkylation response protein AidB-like acyl-CoA dehydrogenase